MLDGLTYWHWWLLAAVLIAIEMLAPGAFFLWLGVAAVVTGLAAFLLAGMGWEYQALIFAVSAMLAIWGSRAWFAKHRTTSVRPNLNRRGAEYVGRRFVLADPIVEGSGKLLIDGIVWRIVGEDLPAGTTISVAAVDGALLQVIRV